MDLAQRWPLTTGLDVRDALLAAYAEPGRHYHDRHHLTEVLDRVAELRAAGAAAPSPEVELAAWFHDAVYDHHPGAERRSADWALSALTPLIGTDPAAEVARLVLLTETHRAGPDDPAGGVLCDADLAILAAGPERYATYAADVRREWAALPDELFAAGRADVLETLLAAPALFHSAHARRHWEAAARANLTAELARLRP